MLEWNDILIRLALAALLGGFVGFERERRDWAAGIRTHMMACVGSALVMMVSSFGFMDVLGTPNVELDPSRVASSVIIGVGYLGAGIILVLKRGNIHGLTTASGLWTTAGVGLAAGGGMYFTAVAATIIALLILYGVQLLQKKLFFTPANSQLSLKVNTRKDANKLLLALLQFPDDISDIAIKRAKNHYQVEAQLFSVAKNRIGEILEELELIVPLERVKLH